MSDDILIEDAAGQEFNFTIPIQGYVLRSIQEDTPVEDNPYNLPPGNYMFVEGGASDASRDKLKGEVTERALIGMLNTINHGHYAPVFHSVERARSAQKAPTVGIDVDHSPSWTDQIGYSVEARAVYDLTPDMVARGAKAPVLVTVDAIDLDMSHGRDLKRALDKGVKLGKSIFGKVVEGKREVSRSGELIRERFDLIDLKRIAYTSAPVNNVTWVNAIRRSMTGADMEDEVIEQEAVVVAEESAADDSVAEVVDASPGTENAAEPVQEETPAVEVERAESTGTESEELPVQGTETESAQPEPTVEESVEAPAAESAEAPAAPIEGEDSVARALGVMEQHFVNAEVYRSFEATVKELLAPIATMPDEIARAHTAIAEQGQLIEAQQELIRSLTERLDKYGKQGQGRFGVVARSYHEEVEGSPEQVFSPEERRQVAKEAAQKGDMGTALAVLLKQVNKPMLVVPQSATPAE